jgi:PAS domain S-box-containing protein
VRLAREITERNQAEEALRLSEERFSKAFKASPIPMGILARQTGRFVDVNENFLALTGLRREEVLDHAATELELSDDPATCQRLFTELQTHGVVRDFAGRLRAVGGQLREVIMAAEVIELRGEPHVLVSWQDITERQRLESQLRQAQKMEGIGQLAAGVAHDFNNILTVIQGHVDLCLTTRTLETPVSDSLKQVGHAADRAAALTRQLLAFSRRQVIQPEVLRLHQVLERSSSMLRRLIGETIKLTFDCPADLPPVYADACSLEQVLMNLTVNARDAMPNGGGLAIRVEVRDLDADAVRRNPEASPGRHICLSVSDTGCGMDTEVRTRAFEPFFTTKGIGKGTGLGLSTVHGIVKQHDGWIELSSRRGNGTTFHVYLPVTDRNATPSRPAPVIEPTPGENETLLVVEDEPDLCQLVCSILEHSGYHVLQAANGLEALELWAAHRDSIRLLLTDMVMPEGLSGCELARRLQAESPELRVIYCSGYSADYQDSGLTLTEGVNFLQKPYSPQRLTDTVRAALNGSELARAA